jgi:CBS domain-containing protein
MSERVRDVMMPVPWTVAADCPLPEAAQLMRSWDVREVFVVDHGRLCGVLTDTDIIVVAIASGRSPSELTAGDCGRADTPRLAADQLLPEALAHMRRHQARRLPVVDGDQLLGTAWIDDLQQAAQAHVAPAPSATPAANRASTPTWGPWPSHYRIP